jgi:hypothetical protein
LDDGLIGFVWALNTFVLTLALHPTKLINRPTAGDKDLDKDNASIAVVGKDHPLQIIEGEALQKYLDAVELEGNAHEPEAMEVASEQGEAMSTS